MLPEYTIRLEDRQVAEYEANKANKASQSKLKNHNAKSSVVPAPEGAEQAEQERFTNYSRDLKTAKNSLISLINKSKQSQEEKVITQTITSKVESIKSETRELFPRELSEAAQRKRRSLLQGPKLFFNTDLSKNVEKQRKQCESSLDLLLKLEQV